MGERREGEPAKAEDGQKYRGRGSLASNKGRNPSGCQKFPREDQFRFQKFTIVAQAPGYISILGRGRALPVWPKEGICPNPIAFRVLRVHRLQQTKLLQSGILKGLLYFQKYSSNGFSETTPILFPNIKGFIKFWLLTFTSALWSQL